MAANGLRMHIAEAGEGRLVLLHGFPECWYSWRRQRFLDSWPSPAAPPGWLTEADLDAYVAEFAGSGCAGSLVH